MDPAWVSLAIAVVGMLLTGVTAYHAARRGTEVAIAVQDQKHSSLKEQVVYLTECKDEIVDRVGNLDLRVGLIEGRAAPRQPLDYG